VPDPLGDASPAGVLELTIYNQSLGLVRQVRTAEILQGTSQVRMADIPSGIIPASVHVDLLDASEDTALLEQRFDYDTVDGDSLLRRYLDQTITVSTQDGQSLTGALLSAGGDIVLLTDYGVEIIRSARVHQISLPPLTEPLITRPTLTWLLNATQAGPIEFRVTYLTSGITWQADYVAMLTDDDTRLDLQSWISIRNDSGASYEEAKLKLVAGEVHRARNEGVYAEDALYKTLEAAPSPAVTERGLMDYHLYDVSRPVTIREGQAKQIEFLQVQDLVVEKQYVLEVTPEIWVRLDDAITDASYGVSSEGSVKVQLQLKNDEEAGLGVPLPQGTVRVYTEDVDGSAILVGEDTIAHTPRNEVIELALGEAFDLVGERNQIGFRQLGERSLEETIEITLRNQSDEPATIQVVEHLYRAHDANIIQSSEEYEQVDANTVRFEVPVKPGDSETVTYTVVYRW